MMVSTFASKQEGPGFKSTVWLGPVCCSHWVLWLPPTVQLLRLIGDSELPKGASVSSDWGPIQVLPCFLSCGRWDKLQAPITLISISGRRWMEKPLKIKSL